MTHFSSPDVGALPTERRGRAGRAFPVRFIPLLLVVVALVAACRAAGSPGSAPARERLVSLSFADADHGWAVAAECPPTDPTATSIGCWTITYESGDGGRTWSRVSRLTLSPRKLQFVGERVGWLIGSIGERCGSNPMCPNVVMRTDDGGQTWVRASTVAGEVVDEAAISGSNAWVLAQVCRNRPACAAVLVTTVSEGQLWENRELPLTGTGFHLQRLGDGASWVGGIAGGTPGSPEPGQAAFLQSLDGGMTWSPRTAPCRGDRLAFDFVSPGDGWLACGDTRAPTISILRTSDGGQTWREVGRIAAASVEASPAGVGATPGPLSLAVTSPEAGWLAFGSGRLVVSHDGGRTWQVALDASEPLQQVEFLDRTRGWALGVDQVWWTTDAGKTWQQARVTGAPAAPRTPKNPLPSI